jgi:hypothetical protein
MKENQNIQTGTHFFLRSISVPKSVHIFFEDFFVYRKRYTFFFTIKISTKIGTHFFSGKNCVPATVLKKTSCCSGYPVRNANDEDWQCSIIRSYFPSENQPANRKNPNTNEQRGNPDANTGTLSPTQGDSWVKKESEICFLVDII